MKAGEFSIHPDAAVCLALRTGDDTEGKVRDEGIGNRSDSSVCCMSEEKILHAGEVRKKERQRDKEARQIEKERREQGRD